MCFALFETCLRLLEINEEFIEFSKFGEKKFQTKNFQISISADIGHKIMLLTFFHIYYDLNPIICKKASLRWCSKYYSLCFLLICHFSQKHQFTLMTRSSSRGVLTVRKVLPSKSMTSQLSNAPSTVFLAILDQKLSHFEFQNWGCYSAFLRPI